MNVIWRVLQECFDKGIWKALLRFLTLMKSLKPHDTLIVRHVMIESQFELLYDLISLLSRSQEPYSSQTARTTRLTRNIINMVDILFFIHRSALPFKPGYLSLLLTVDYGMLRSL
jgi:hypothetical protein